MLKEFLEHNNPCDICLDEKCGGKHTCNCSTCKMLAECPKFLRAVIRITNKCTQACSHCCFKSSPKSNIMMNIEMAKDMATFIKSNKVCDLNVMGGEFFCNPYWYEILSILVDSTHSMRLVTNGDWAIDNEMADKVVEFINLNKNKVRIAISKDKWHTNKNIEKAEEYIKQTGALYHVALPSETTDSSIVPIGRSELEYTPFYSFLGCYCHKPYEQYTFLIDENGDIYKCGFGAWKYANIKEYISGGFNKKFKEFNKKFYDIFVPSCRHCLMCCKEKDRVKTD